jgi:hypothetical protein
MTNYSLSGNEKVKCHSCGREMIQLSKHWEGEKYNCDYPKLTERQESILKGMLMGDASLARGNSLPYVQMSLINEDFLYWIKQEISEMGAKYRLVETASEVASRARDSDWNKDCEVKDCNDVYQLTTSIHPSLENFEIWYDGGHKTFPKDSSINSLSAKVWYCCDGDLKIGTTKHHKPIARITSRNESHRADFLISLFEECGFEPYWEEQSSKICFTVEETPRFLEWMGNAPPGFEYKWI